METKLSESAGELILGTERIGHTIQIECFVKFHFFLLKMKRAPLNFRSNFLSCVFFFFILFPNCRQTRLIRITFSHA